MTERHEKNGSEQDGNCSGTNGFAPAVNRPPAVPAVSDVAAGAPVQDLAARIGPVPQQQFMFYAVPIPMQVGYAQSDQIQPGYGQHVQIQLGVSPHLGGIQPFHLPSTSSRRNSNRKLTFPMKLHQILSNRSYQDMITWLPHGRSWRVLDPDAFAKRVIPLYFRHAKFSSFMRQVSKDRIAVAFTISIYSVLTL